MFLVFLHGKGGDKNSYHEQAEALAEHLSSDFVSFNAPFFNKNDTDKFAWFNKIERNNRKDAIEEEYSQAIDYIIEKLRQLPCPLLEIVLIGHSQGGGMAADVALRTEIKCAFSICGDMPYNMKYQVLSETPVYWFEGKNDTYISDERKASYKLLQDLGADIRYHLIPNCTHTEIDSAFAEIEKILKRGVK